MAGDQQAANNGKALTVYEHASTGSDARSLLRVHVSAHLLKKLKIQGGDLVMVKPSLSADELKRKLDINGKGKAKLLEDQPVPGFAIGNAWPAFTLDANTMEMSAAALRSAGLQEGDIASVIPLPPIGSPDAHVEGAMALPQAEEIVFRRIKGRQSSKTSDQSTRTRLMELAFELSVIAPGQFINLPTPAKPPASPVKGTRDRSASPFVPKSSPLRNGTSPRPPSAPAPFFQVVDIKPRSRAEDGGPELFRVVPTTRIHLEGPSRPPRGVAAGEIGSDEPAFSTIGGLDQQIARIRDLVELPLTRPELYAHFGLAPPRGILLYGPSGTGKTLLCSLIARATGSSLLPLSATTLTSPYHGETEQAIVKLFDEAKRASPCIIVCDEIDGFCPRREDGGEVERRVVGTMIRCLDTLHEPPARAIPSSDPDVSEDDSVDDADQPTPRVVVVATTNRINALDPALRRPGRFDHEIEIGSPSAEARLAILGVLLRRTPHSLSPDVLADIANRTHGFVGADLVSLAHTAGLNAIKRSLASSSSTTAEMRLEQADVESALLVTRPSAMRELFVETPKVAWSDIGGQDEVKQRLRESVEWPIKHPDTFKRLGIRPPRGVLLYGPPGCSKTLTARALASEGGLNFISIKGPELFSKYVGESERAIRELFGKARAAAPSIIFLDEIDAIAMSRGSDDGGSGTGDRVLTSLLTELDGVEELNGVLVLAATNRPDVLDSALLRPGRLDRILYVGPPDLRSRVDIFKINFRRMAVADDVDADELAGMTDHCTGAEIAAVCQDAALHAMNENLDAPDVARRHFLQAANAARPRTTPETIAAFEAWRDRSGVRSA